MFCKTRINTLSIGPPNADSHRTALRKRLNCAIYNGIIVIMKSTLCSKNAWGVWNIVSFQPGLIFLPVQSSADSIQSAPHCCCAEINLLMSSSIVFPLIMYRWKNPQHKFLLLLGGQCIGNCVYLFFFLLRVLKMYILFFFTYFLSMPQERKGFCMKSHLRSDSSSVRCLTPLFFLCQL